MRIRHSLPLLAASALLCSFSGLKADTNGMSEFLKTKYGFFVHYVWGGDRKKSLTVGRDGEPLATFDEFAAAFDTPGFARDLEKWSVEYVILTAWHYNINPLFPSETLKRWGMENHTCKRDLLRDVITACKAKGIKVMFHPHPRDGHDLSQEDQIKTGWGGPNGTDPDWAKFDRRKWNDFTNELYQELITRYGNDIIGIFSDEGSAAGDSYRVVDYPRLRQTVKTLQTDLIMEQNFHGTTFSLDVGCKEYAYWGGFANRDGNAWPTAQRVKLPDLEWGVATSATDGKTEYLHILTPPADGSRSLTLPPPADGRKFEKAVLLASKKPVALKQDESGLHLKLPDGGSWDKLDTVIALKVAADSPLQNLALWKAFRGSSFPDPTSKAAYAYAFYAVDGDPTTAWASRQDGVTEGESISLGGSKPWIIEVPAGTTAQLIRLARTQSGAPLRVNEFRVFGHFK